MTQESKGQNIHLAQYQYVLPLKTVRLLNTIPHEEKFNLLEATRDNITLAQAWVNNQLKATGEEVVSWKRQIESWITSQSLAVKTSLSVISITTVAVGSFALAQVGTEPDTLSSFDVYRSVRTAEAALKDSQAIPQADKAILVATALDAADNYIDEIFGTNVKSRIPAAELATRQPLQSPLPDNVMGVDNGAAPLPTDTIASAFLPGFTSRALLWPMRGGQVSSRFGMRWGRMHQGTDISAPYGTPILAAADGKVIHSGWEGGYGKLVIVDHGNGVKTKYGHCSTILVGVGTPVHQGDILGKVGSTGFSTGPHLHYEVIREGKASNPEFFTRRR